MPEEINGSNLITVFSTSSAVGKTLLSVNMAAALAQAGNSVCIVDLDLQFGDVCHYLQLEPEKTIFDAQQAIAKNETDFSAEKYSLSYKCGEVGFSVLAAPLKMEQAYNIAAPAVQRVINSLRPQFDYIVVDTTAAFSELNLAVMDKSTLITFVGIVDFIPTIKNMKIGYDTMRSIGYEKDRIRFILNRSDSKTSISPEDVEQLLEERFYHVLPNNFSAAMGSIDCGLPLVLDREPTALGRSLQELVTKYTTGTAVTAGSNKSVKSWVRRLLK